MTGSGVVDAGMCASPSRPVIESVDTIPPFLGAPAPPCYPDRALPSPAVAKGDGLGWLNRLLGSKTSDPSPSFDALQPGDEVWSGGQPWQVTAVLTYKNAEGTWPVVRIQQALTTAWTSVEDDRPVRYDHLDLHVGGDGRAVWNGRTYTRQEVGSASIERVLGDVDAR